MDFSISTDNYKVVSSGMVILYGPDSELKFSIVASNNFSFDVVLKFAENDDGKKGVNKEVDGNTIIFKCINFNGALGTGTTKPLPIATVSGKDISMQFWSYLLGDKNSARKVEYTFLE